MKKVLFIVPSLKMGGMEKVLVSYANLFVKRGYDVTVYNLTGDEKLIVDHFDKRIRYKKQHQPIKHLFKSGINDILKGNFRLLPLNKWFNFHSSRYIHKKYVKELFDVEIAFFGDYSAIIVGGCRNGARKVVFYHNNNICDYYSNHLRAYKRLSGIINNFDCKICVSGTVKNDFIKAFGNSEGLVTINNPVETHYIRQLSQEDIDCNKDCFTFINVSRIDDEHKGFIRLLNVCKRLSNDGLRFCLWIIGDGPDMSKVKTRAEELGLDNVVFFGKQSNPYKFMSKADMYVCSSFHEGFSISMAESLSLGLPMLSTDVSGAREMMGDSEFGLVVENSEDGLYNGMKQILLDKSLFEHYKQKAKERMDYFSEKKIMERLESVIWG